MRWPLPALAMGLGLAGCGGCDPEPTSTSASPRLPGAPEDRVSLTLIEPPPPGAEEIAERAEYGGLPMSDRRLVLALAPDATVGAVNALLDAHDLTPIGASPLGILIVATEPDFARTIGLAALLSARPEIAGAAPETLLFRATHPPAASGGPWDFSVEPRGGNYGLELIRAPAAWSLRRSIARAARPPIRVAVLDEGVEAHRDLDGRLDVLGDRGPASDQGLHVACIIAANPDDGFGANGVSPFAHLAFRAIGAPYVPPSPSNLDVAAGIGQMLILGTRAILSSTAASARVVNVSAGYSWDRRRTDPYAATASAARSIVAYHAAIAHRFILNANTGGREVLFVVAAGNDGGPSPGHWDFGRPDVLAVLSSPWTAAALGPLANPNILVVEGAGLSEPNLATADASGPGSAELNARGRYHAGVWVTNVGGHLAAPGRSVWSCAPNQGHARLTGSSMAAPHVAGAASYLLALEPSLSNAELVRLLRGNTPHNAPFYDPSRAELPTVLPQDGRHTAGWVAPPAPLLDLFAAALSIDLLRGGDRVARALVDTDDGTRDGSTRALRDERGVLVDRDHAADLGGDGVVDMRDFRRFRDALLYAENRRVAFDGVAAAIKHDGNQDGVVGDAGRELLGSRFDFNGDGLLGRGRIDWPGQWATARADRERSDLEVLAGLFATRASTAARAPDTGGWEARDLEHLIESADIEVHVGELLAQRMDIAAVEVAVESELERWPRRPDDFTDIDRGTRARVRREAIAPIVLTVPAIRGAELALRFFDAGGQPIRLEDVPVRVGRPGLDAVDEQARGERARLGDLVPGQDYWLMLRRAVRVSERLAFVRVEAGRPGATGVFTVTTSGAIDRLTGLEEGRTGGVVACHPGGEYIYFLSKRTDARVDLYRIRTDGTVVELRSAEPFDTDYSELALSPTEARAVLVDRGRIVGLDLVSLERRVLHDGAGQWLNPSYTPDGRGVVVCDGRRIWRMPSEGGAPTPLTPETVMVGGLPVGLPLTAIGVHPAPRTGRLAFVTNWGTLRHLPMSPPPEVSPTELYWVAPEGGEVFTPITDRSGSRFTKLWPAWSPSERQVAFTGSEVAGTPTSIYLTPAGGGAIRAVFTSTSATISSLCWIP